MKMSRIKYYSFGIKTHFFRKKKKILKISEYNLAGPTYNFHNIHILYQMSINALYPLVSPFQISYSCD